MVFKLYSRWPETRVCCPETLCSGHLENKGVVGTLPGIETQGSYSADTRYSTSSSLFVNRSITSTHAQQSTALNLIRALNLYRCVRGIAT